ncbi:MULTISPECIES: GNAT family N-acetyltransferase [Shewanella]|uniref:GNAT family N-acetyltransferase n=1 Tax=Shewanella TaxID=22 RepID=UPI002494AC02|nr:GNAT family N-acetyltransferase [Shewanella japonica]
MDEIKGIFKSWHNEVDTKLVFNFTLNAPSAEEFNRLRAETGWGSAPVDTVNNSLNNSLFFVCVFHETRLIATGRVIGDGGLFFYIQDVIVAKAYQGNGLGHFIMQAIEMYLTQQVTQGTTVGLFCAQGKEGFYKKYQYLVRDGSELGFGMCKFY